jgi:hypothetical protein
MFFLIIFLPLLGVIGDCLFRRQLSKDIIHYTILNIWRLWGGNLAFSVRLYFFLLYNF